jgi:hypothetical protein
MTKKPAPTEEQVRKRLHRASDFLRRREPLQWLVPGILPAAMFYFLTGNPKEGGKTILSTAMAMAMARGTPFLGRKIERPLSVLCYNMEDGDGLVADLLGKLGWREDEAERNLIIMEQGAAVDEFLAAVEIYHPDVAIIDPMIEAFRECGYQHENDSVETSAFCKMFHDATRSYDTTILMVNHTNKGGEKMRGSSAIPGVCDGWLTSRMIDERKGIRQLSVTHRRAPSELTYFSITSDSDTGSLSVDSAEKPKRGGSGDGQDDDESDITGAVLDAIRGGATSVRKIADVIHRGNDKISASLRELCSAGQIEKMGKTGWVIKP